MNESRQQKLHPQPPTAWHALLGYLLKERAPKSFTIITEYELGKRPPRVDVLFLRRTTTKSRRTNSPATVLRKLWKCIDYAGVLEYKSPKTPLNRGDIEKLKSYVHAFIHGEAQHLLSTRQVTAVLLVPCWTEELAQAVSFSGIRLTKKEEGYLFGEGSSFPFHIILLDEVSLHEQDNLLGIFGHGTISEPETAQWFLAHTGAEMAKSVKDLPGYQELLQHALDSLSLEQRLAGLDPEQRLVGLKPEQRLAGLKPEQRLAGLKPEEILKALSPETVEALGNEILKRKTKKKS